ncbi:MAG: hypothetical protein OXG06_02100 [Gammaproteobacteria bacterium]|nr:hypothetical protein [Gammaproteobacteria bacterium]
MEYIIPYLFAFGLCGLLAFAIQGENSEGKGLAFALGFLFGPLGILIVLITKLAKTKK